MSKCSICGTPLLASYCGSHDPSGLVRLARRIDYQLGLVKLYTRGFGTYTPEELDQRSEELEQEEKLQQLAEEKKQ